MDPKELALKAGQSVLILDQRDNDWWWGQADRKTGWFPAAFVRVSNKNLSLSILIFS